MNPIKVDVILKADLFRKFANFDTLFRTGRLKKLLLFSAVTIVLSVLPPLFSGQAIDANFRPNGLLLAFAIFVPLLFVGGFLRTVRYQIQKMGFCTGKFVYSLTFTDAADGIWAKNEEEERSFSWQEIHAAYYFDHAIYFYVAKRHAFLLPVEQIEGGADALWALITQQSTKEKLFDRRKK